MKKRPHPGKGLAKAHILSCAAEMFAHYGYHGVSTREIASEAGVNEVTVYRHFRNKRDLYMAVLEAELQQVKLSGDLLAQVAEARDGKIAVLRAFDLISSAMTQRSELLRLMQFSALEMREDIDLLMRRHLGQLVEVIAHYLEPWVNKSELSCRSAKDLVLSLIAIHLSQRSLHRIFSSDSTSPDAICRAFAEFSFAE